jgi:hypothetical protein
LDDLSVERRTILKWIPKKIEWEGGERIHLGQDMEKMASSCEYSNERSDCIKYWEFLFSLNNLGAFDLFYLHPENFNKILSLTEHIEIAKHSKICMETYATISWLRQDIDIDFGKVMLDHWTSLKYLNMSTHFIHW